MDYNASHLQPKAGTSADNAPSAFSAQIRPLHEPYQLDQREETSSAFISRHISWHVSPIQLQQSLPPMASLDNNSTDSMASSLFASRAVLTSPYQEPVMWGNMALAPLGDGRQEGIGGGVQRIQDASKRRSYAKEPRRYFRHPRHIMEAWKSGVWLRFPWVGFGALFMVFILTGTSAGILLAANKSSPDQWRLGKDNAQPPVYLSVFEMVSNFLMLFALVDGIVIKFWRELLHGTTLSAIHDIYQCSSLWWACKRAMKLQFNSVVVALRGPLFQRALTINSEGRLRYHTDKVLVVIGVIFSTLGIVATLPLYIGFWELGRKVSLNPLEIARAFGAPMMEGMDGNATGDMVTIERGGMNVRYGVLERYGSEKKLRVEETARVAVRMPWQGEVFG